MTPLVTILKFKDTLRPEVLIDGQQVDYSKLVLRTWVNGEGEASEHVQVIVTTEDDRIFDRCNVRMEFQNGLTIKTTTRGLGVYMSKRISLVLSLRYTFEKTSLSKLEIEAIAT
jgi:hypothetical protein